MATKDWKKIGKDVWYNRKTKDDISIVKSLNKNYVVWLRNVSTRMLKSEYETRRLKTFKTKLQALKFAKAYMRKH